MEGITTQLFMLTSLDGKISTGCTDKFDFDTDFANDTYLSMGLQQYYDAEKNTFPCSIISGKIVSKLGANEYKYPKCSVPITFVVIDNNHLTLDGLKSIAMNCNKLIVVTKNSEVSHNAFELFNIGYDITTITYSGTLNPAELLMQLRDYHGITGVTIQTGGTLNSVFLNSGVVDRVDIVIAPCIVGGQSTPSLCDGRDKYTGFIENPCVKLVLEGADVLNNSYLYLHYTVLKEMNVQ